MRSENTTIEYYDNNAISFVNSSIDADMHPMADLFLQYLPDQAKILDLGCGTGRDSLYFLQHVDKLHAAYHKCSLLDDNK